MNERRFIELLNLYVDQELTDDEARALEQEIAQDPERRRIYTQYCRMQRACVRLFEQHSAPAPRIQELAAAATAAGPATEVVDFPVAAREPVVVRQQRGWVWAAWSGGLVAAAACVALVAIRQAEFGGNPAPMSEMAVTESIAPAEPQLAATEVPANVGSKDDKDYRPVVVVNALLRPASEQATPQPAGMAALDPLSLDSLQEMKLLPMRRVPFETLRFDLQGRLQEVDQTAFATDQTDQPVATEISAFQFQR